jgi:hypothetical protein
MMMLFVILALVRIWRLLVPDLGFLGRGSLIRPDVAYLKPGS